ncbi:hypothetical protein V8C42DRAFT_94367 [Trichoderma barbatum]
MPPRLITIDADGDTLIILPFVAAIGVNDNATNNTSIPAANISNGDAAASKTKVTKVESEETLRFKVSMRHLMLASPRAKAVLQGPFKEATPHTSDNLLHWQFEPLFDPKAFEIVMNIIHARNDKIPNVIALGLLANIAAIVDDLQCRNSVGFFASLWAKNLAIEPPSEISIDLARIILISSVFRLSELFESSTLQAILGSTKDMPVFGLPISSDILDAIDVRRNAMLKRKMNALYEIGETFHNAAHCLTCRAGAIGLWVINMRSQKFSMTLSSEPINISLRDLETKVKCFVYLRSDRRGFCPDRSRNNDVHPSLEKEIDSFLKSFYSDVQKLKLR